MGNAKMSGVHCVESASGSQQYGKRKHLLRVSLLLPLICSGCVANDAETDSQQNGITAAGSAPETIAKVTLVRADNRDTLETLTNDSTINLSSLATSSLSIQAATSPASVGSVKFVLDGDYTHTENLVPYTLCGKAGSADIACAKLNESGSHTLVIVPYSGSGASGNGGSALTIRFTVESSATGKPSQPTNLTLTHQGQNSGSLEWSASTGSDVTYKVYRSDNLDTTPVLVGTTQETSFTDNSATGTIIFAGYNAAAGPTSRSYSYSVVAANSSGESAAATDVSAWFFRGEYYGGDALSSKKDYDYAQCGTMTSDYTYPDNSDYGPYDVKITSTCDGAIWQPFSGGTFLDPIRDADDMYAMDIGSFKYMTIDLKPEDENQAWKLSLISRIPSPPNNDAFNTAHVTLTAAPGAEGKGQWHTYKIPLQGNNSLQIGRGEVDGFIQNGKLHVTNLVSGIPIEGGTWISGHDIPAGTAILSTDSINGGPGTSGPGVYPISGPGINDDTNTPPTTILIQRTNFYKISLADVSPGGGKTYYINKVGFTNF